ncbi:up-regulator of cell proliferation-like [Aplochiton taeniatus]
MQLLPSAFLKKLLMSNVNSRSVKCVTTPNSNINPLDLITAMFLCSDGFLQQEMVLKMSMCQFAVPLLLPNCETKQSTLMVWAMRDIVKKCMPYSHNASKSFVEERVVLSDMPMVSFVRLGESRLPKSQTLNKLLSNCQQYHDTYIHGNMEGGNVQREISDGLVEISWYLPCGNSNIDMFKKPVAMANLRGDIKTFEREFSFLCQTSAAVYIFCDEIETAHRFLKGKNTEAEIFVVVNTLTDFKTDGKSKIRVVTVLGVQGSGKSTFLNTMFGVQFAVSSGRCTRGAFMLLLGVNKDLKEELKCDFVMVIDTEGLKSPELAQLEDSYEHDNKLATLVIGLSDVTIINIAMENSTEMKDILQIVVHAFIRMKEVGKKPVCNFVHQNVSDMSARDNNMRGRNKLLEQLNEMTVAAAKMEKKEKITKFTDVMLSEKVSGDA